MSKEKRIWRLTFEDSAVALASNKSLFLFHLYDNNGSLVRTGSNRFRLSDLAFEMGATELRHDYDLAKYGG